MPEMIPDFYQVNLFTLISQIYTYLSKKECRKICYKTHFLHFYSK